MDELIARGFWGPRQESPVQIADKLVAFLAALDDVVGEALRWSSPHLADGLIADPANALQVIEEAFRRNVDAPHLGVTQAYDARGEKTEDSSITMSVGGYSEAPNVRNAFVLTWRGEDAGVFADPILRQLISVWEPDWAAVGPRSFMRALSEVQPVGTPEPKIGCLTYLSVGRAQALPGGIDKYVERLDDGGVVLGSGEGDGFLSVDEATELAKMLRLSAAFSPTSTSRSRF